MRQTPRQVPGRGGERGLREGVHGGYGVSLGYLHKGISKRLCPDRPLVAKASSDAMGSGRAVVGPAPLSAPIQTSEHKYQYFRPMQAWGARKDKAHRGVRHRGQPSSYTWMGPERPSTHPAQLWR